MFAHPPRLAQRTRRAGACLILASALLGPGSPAQPVLNFDDALRLAQKRSHQLVAQDAAAAASREMAVAAGQLPAPTLTAGFNNVPVNGPDSFSLTRDFMTQSTIGIAQQLTAADKRQARAARFEREAEAAELGRAAALAALRRDTATAWLARHYQERMLDVLRAQQAEAALQVEAADAAYRGGRGTQADVFAARSAAAQLDDRVRQTQSQAATARTKLARWVGAEASLPLGVLPDVTLLRPGADALQAGWEQRPELALMRRQEAVAQAEADIARTHQRADWSVDLSYSQRGPAYSNMVSLNVSIPLQIDPKNRQDRELAARLALAEQLRAQREEAERELAAETRSWAQQWQAGRERLAAYDSTLLPLAAERTRAALAGYRGGGGPLNAVLEARRAELETRLDRLRLALETAALWAQLETLIPPAREAAATVKEK